MSGAAGRSGALGPVVVVGAGISGLAAAWTLRGLGARVTVLEAAPRVGGSIATECVDGYVVELGPNSLFESEAVRRLVGDLELDGERIAATGAARRRYVVRAGAPHALPAAPPAAVASPILSARAKLRLCAEPLVAARRDGDDESVAAFVRRRLGGEVLDYLVDPFIGGVCAGDPERLSARHVLRRAVELERDHGSLAAGAWRAARARGRAPAAPGRGPMISFRRGLSTLPDAIAARLGAAVRLGEGVVGLRRAPTGWAVRTSAGGEGGGVPAAAVVFATPAHALSTVRLPAGVREALSPARVVEHAPVSTLALGFRRADVAHALDGFGLLAPWVERRTILGALFNSAAFAGRAPHGHVLVTCFAGGVRRPELAAAASDALLPLVLADLRELLGVTGAPTFVRHTRWPRAIPQYGLGHDAVTAAAARAEREAPGLFLAGQYLDGAGVGDCIASGQAAARRAAAWLRAQPAPREAPRLPLSWAANGAEVGGERR